ncbi:MAG: HD domain-containing protein [Pseudomonadota bacterium]
MTGQRQTVSFTEMKHGTKADYEFLHQQEQSYLAGTADRLLRELASQADETLSGYKITRLEHGLQAATRARREGADIDWVVATLLHDIGDGLAPQNHDKFAAEIMRPFLREEVVWVVEHHGIFQMYYYAHHYGWDRELRQTYKDSPYYRSCVDFCERWDQSSFDPDYPMDALESFAGDVRAVFSRKAYDEAHTQPGLVLGLPTQEAAAS